nr:hypothetical protein [Nostoc sp. ChiSLP03a]
MDLTVHLCSKQASDVYDKLRRFAKEVKKIWEGQNQSTSLLCEQLLQVLASVGVFTETEIDYFTLTQLIPCI